VFISALSETSPGPEGRQKALPTSPGSTSSNPAKKRSTSSWLGKCTGSDVEELADSGVDHEENGSAQEGPVDPGTVACGWHSLLHLVRHFAVGREVVGVSALGASVVRVTASADCAATPTRRST
jgi:hypothetical protein